MGRWIARGGLWVGGQAVLLAALVLLPRVGPLWPRVRWPGLPVLVTGGALVLLGGAALASRSSLTEFPVPRTDGTLAREGVYAVVRHPIYGGVILLAFGWALWRQSPLHLVLAAAAALFFDRKAAYEERWLLRRFPDYAGYRRRVRKLIPGIY